MITSQQEETAICFFALLIYSSTVPDQRPKNPTTGQVHTGKTGLNRYMPEVLFTWTLRNSYMHNARVNRFMGPAVKGYRLSQRTASLRVPFVSGLSLEKCFMDTPAGISLLLTQLSTLMQETLFPKNTVSSTSLPPPLASRSPPVPRPRRVTRC